MTLGAKGPAQVVVTACASSTDALGVSLDMIRAGRADVVIAGGTEATIAEFAVGGFMKMKALATQFNDRPEKASRPFNADRCGCRWPVIDLVEDTASLYAWPPNTVLMAAVSQLSFRWVDVPWALM